MLLVMLMVATYAVIQSQHKDDVAQVKQHVKGGAYMTEGKEQLRGS